MDDKDNTSKEKQDKPGVKPAPESILGTKDPRPDSVTRNEYQHYRIVDSRK